MSLERKKAKRVAKIITRIDRKTQSVTAGVNFEDIDLTIDGEGSEVYDYERHFLLHDTGASSAVVKTEFNNLTSYSRDFMYGQSSTANALSLASSDIWTGRVSNSAYPAYINDKLTGYVGNKRHVDGLKCYYSSTNGVSKESNYTADTSTELTSMQLYFDATATITYSLIIIAVPKIQYNPNAIRLPRVEWSSQSDTRNVSGFSGEDYDVFLDSHLNTSVTNYIDVRVNGVATSTRTRQQMQNAGGTLSSANTTQSIDARLHTGTCRINKEIGRKSITTVTNNITTSPQQTEQYTTETNTSTEFTNVDLIPSGTITGYVDPYLVPKGYNADLTPWAFRQEFFVNNVSFSVGNNFTIPNGAMFARIQAIGESISGSNIEIDFDATTTVDKQYLKSSTSSTTAAFATNRTIGKIHKVSNIDCIVSLKPGANRPILSQSQYNENTIDTNGLWAKDSSTTYTQLNLKADNTNAMTAKFVVSFI